MTVEPTKRPFQGRAAKAYGRQISRQFEGEKGSDFRTRKLFKIPFESTY
jgi:hypothetical protein